MRKLKTWEIVLLVIFYPVGICVLVYRLWKKSKLKQEAEEAARLRGSEREAKVAAERERKAEESAYRSTVDRLTYKVVGVTFNNDDSGRNRQEILREIEEYCPRPSSFSLEVYDFEGEPAVGVFYNGEQVGNISKQDLPGVLPRMEGYDGFSDFAVTGGGDKYGLEIAVYFKKAATV